MSDLSDSFKIFATDEECIAKKVTADNYKNLTLTYFDPMHPTEELMGTFEANIGNYMVVDLSYHYWFITEDIFNDQYVVTKPTSKLTGWMEVKKAV